MGRIRRSEIEKTNKKIIDRAIGMFGLDSVREGYHWGIMTNKGDFILEHYGEWRLYSEDGDYDYRFPDTKHNNIIDEKITAFFNNNGILMKSVDMI